MGHAFLLMNKGETDTAEEMYCSTLDHQRAKFGARHPDTLVTMTNLGTLLEAENKIDDAERLLREAVAGYRAQNLNTAAARMATDALDLCLRTQGKDAEAEAA